MTRARSTGPAMHIEHPDELVLEASILCVSGAARTGSAEREVCERARRARAVPRTINATTTECSFSRFLSAERHEGRIITREKGEREKEKSKGHRQNRGTVRRGEAT